MRELLFLIIFFSALNAVIIFSSAIVAKRFKISTSLAVMCVYSILILLSYLFDYLRLPIIFAAVSFSIVLVVAVLFAYIKERENPVAFISNINYRDLAFQYVGWFVGFLFLLLPLLTVFPQGTVVVGNEVINDVVIHSIFARGFEETDVSGTFDNHVDYFAYPRGFHSFAFLTQTITQLDTRLVTVVGTLFIFSLTFFAIYAMLPKKYSNTSRVLISLFAQSPYLLKLTALVGFSTQATCIPFLIIASYVAIGATKELQNFQKRLLLLLLLSIALGCIYSFFGAHILAGIVGLNLLYFFFENRKDLKSLGKRLKFTLPFVLAALVILVIGIPTLLNLVDYLKTVINKVTYYYSATGNLGRIFIPPLHFSGTWLEVEYRRTPNNLNSYLLLSLIMFYGLVVGYARKLRKDIIIPIILLSGLMFWSLIISGGPYAHFKYFTFVLPFLFTLIGISVLTVVNSATVSIPKFSSIVLVAVFAVFLIVNNVFSLRTFAILPSLQKEGDRFTQLEQLQEDYLQDNSTLLFSSDDWLHYYKDKNDITPFTVYVAYRLTDAAQNKYDYVIIDKNFLKRPLEMIDDVDEYLLSIDINLNDACLEETSRFKIYEVECLQ